MDFSYPWTPSSKGNALAPCEVIADLVGRNRRPSVEDEDERAWMLSTNDEALAQISADGKGALEESLLAIWRLQRRTKRGTWDKNWRMHVRAWLVRYRDLCSFLKVSPLQTVVKFVDDLQDRALAFEDGLPSFEVLESSSDTTTDALNEPSKKATSATEKGKQRAIEDDPSDRSTSQAEQDDLEGSTRSSKRSQFFSHVELVSKRWDVVSDKDKDVDELETGEETEEEPPVPAKSAGSLSAFSVNEGDPVLKEMVPMTHKQICQRCVRKPHSRCIPVWLLHYGVTATISCETCMKHSIRCSFRDRNWGIDGWPKIERMRERHGMARPSSKRNVGSRSPKKPKAPSLTQSASSSFYIEHHTDSLRSRVEHPISSTSLGAFVPLVPWENELKNPERSSTSLGEVAAKIHATIAMEEGSRQVVDELVRRRRKVMDSLLRKVNREIEKLDDVDSTSDGEEEADK